MTECELKELIMKYQFYAVDLNLFLDTHPDCKEAIEDYKVISTKLEQAIKEYEKNYAPLINFGQSKSFNHEAWVNSPWPWENEN